MKKRLAVLILIFAMFIMPLPAQADDTPRVFLDGQELTFDVPPVIVDGRVLVPFSKTFEALGRDAHWVESQQAILSYPNFWLAIGDNIAYLGDQTIDLDVPAQIVDGRVMIPLRVVAAVCFCKVTYDQTTNTVSLESGNARINTLYVFPGFNPINQATLDGSFLRNFNINGFPLIAKVSFKGEIAKPTIFRWYHEENNKKELILQETKNVVNNVASSILPQDKFKIGKWTLETGLNEQTMQPYYFKIDDDSKNFGTVNIPEGQYTGYLKDGYPSDFGELTTKDGTKIIGYMGCWKINNSRDLDFIYAGLWRYPDGVQYVGKMERNGYSFDTSGGIHYGDPYIDGAFTGPNATKTEVKGYSYNEWGPSVRYDKVPIYQYPRPI